MSSVTLAFSLLLLKDVGAMLLNTKTGCHYLLLVIYHGVMGLFLNIAVPCTLKTWVRKGTYRHTDFIYILIICILNGFNLERLLN